jgi:hypothetical protein
MTVIELAEAQARDLGTAIAAALRGAVRCLGAPAIPPNAAGTDSRAARPARHRRAATAGHGPAGLALPGGIRVIPAPRPPGSQPAR